MLVLARGGGEYADPLLSRRTPGHGGGRDDLRHLRVLQPDLPVCTLRARRGGLRHPPSCHRPACPGYPVAAVAGIKSESFSRFAGYWVARIPRAMTRQEDARSIDGALHRRAVEREGGDVDV